MRKKIECEYISPITGENTISIIEAFFITDQNFNSQVEIYFDTRIAPLKCLKSYKTI